MGVCVTSQTKQVDEEDRLYHVNQGANKDLAKAFGEMVVASRSVFAACWVSFCFPCLPASLAGVSACRQERRKQGMWM